MIPKQVNLENKSYKKLLNIVLWISFIYIYIYNLVHWPELRPKGFVIQIRLLIYQTFIYWAFTIQTIILC